MASSSSPSSSSSEEPEPEPEEEHSDGEGDGLESVRQWEREHIEGLDRSEASLCAPSHVCNHFETEFWVLWSSTKKVGQWFIIESQWLSRWRGFVGGGERPGAIDNRCLVEADEQGV